MTTEAAPRLLPIEIGWDPSALTVTDVPNPLEGMTLGAVGPAMLVAGPDVFPPTLLVRPLAPQQCQGIDPASIRVVRVEVGDTVRGEDAEFAVLWDSGFSPGLDFVRARIQQPGRYVAIGLPADRLLRELLRELAARRRYTRHSSPPSDTAGLTRAVLAPLLDAEPHRIAAIRATLAQADATVTGSTSLADIKFGRRAEILPAMLPGDMSLDELRERIAVLEGADRGLPEEELFYPPSTAFLNTAFLDTAFLDTGGGVAPGAADVLRQAGTGASELLRRADTETLLAGPPASANWWMYHHDPSHSGVAVDSHITKLTVGRLRLRTITPMPGPVISAPVVVDSKVYVGTGNSLLAPGSSGGTMCRIDLASGLVERVFTFATPPMQGSRQGMAGIGCTPAVTGGRIYFSGLDGRFYCLDADSLQPIWITDMRHADPAHNQPVTHRVAAEGWSSPLVVNDRVYVGWGESESNTFGFVYCLDAGTGDVVWLFCTNLFGGVTDNEPNVVPRSLVGMPLPARFTAHADPPNRGASPWSSAAYDSVSRRVVIGTGNVYPPERTLPQPKYNLGVLSLKADNGTEPQFFQPAPADCYRPDDSDVDVPPGPTIFDRGDRRVVAIGGKSGSFFLLDPDTLTVLPHGRRQLLPRRGGNGGFPGDPGDPLPGVDPRPRLPDGSRQTENFYGIFSSAAVHAGLRRLFVGVGGFAFGISSPGIDSATTPFLRALNWDDLTDAWVTAAGPDGVRRYVTTSPPMYLTPGEAGFASPAVVNDVVLMTTSRPGMYAFDAETGVALWGAPGFGPPVRNSFTLGPAVYGDFVVVGSANIGVLTYSL